MKKQILLTIHIGKGRCGSTLLQKCLGIMHGKNGIYFVGKPFDNILFDLHNKIINDNQNQYSIKEKREFIKNYCNYICSIIRKNKKSNHFIISDENISDGLNYQYRKNFISLKLLISLIKEKLNEYKLNISISMNIREQYSILQSIYNFFHFSVEPNKFLKQNKKFLKSFDYYSLYKSLKKEIGQHNIYLIPYELLKDKNGLKKYVCETFKINKIDNSLIRKFYKLGALNESKNMKNSIIFKTYQKLPDFLKKFFKFKFFKKFKEKEIKKKGLNILFNETVKKSIQNKYKKNNKKLKNLKCLRGFDLKKYG